MCIWALIQEHAFFEDRAKELLTKNVRTMWPKHWTMPEIKPGPTLTFPDPAWVPRDPKLLHAHGMTGWFAPTCRTLFTVTIDSVHVPFIAMGLWDSHPEGRTGHIIARSPRSQHMFLRKYFLRIDILCCQLSENA